MKISEFLWKCYSDAVYIPVYQLLYKKWYKSLKIASINETMDKISEGKVSVSRYGDGEFLRMSLSKKEDSYQKNSKELSTELIKILNSNKKDHMVCLPQAFRNPNILTSYKYFEREMGMHGKQWLSLIDKDKEFFNTSVTRPYMDEKDKSISKYVFKKFRELWCGKKVLIIEGDETKFGLGNDLLGTANKVIRMECPAMNAFDIYDQLKESAKECIQENRPDIVLVALGPTATLLCYDLADFNDSQLIDVGHLDIEYSWYQMNATKRVPVPGKYVNEVEGHITNKDLYENSDEYENEIVKMVGLNKN